MVRVEKMKDSFVGIYFMLNKEEKITEDYYKRYFKPNDNPNFVEYDPLIHGWRGQEPRRNWVPPVSVAPKTTLKVTPQTSGRAAEEAEETVAEAGDQLLDGSPSTSRRSGFKIFCQCFGKK
ncbi:unnamed protein product [Nezara viridula]|uniref:Uncharacterized protein n=1 Tax=Nezara viridula TaxID=85310 RepID=A0A9P0E5I0_NEZVI|nr:unnamed protein product [Nezara viridula]